MKKITFSKVLILIFILLISISCDKRTASSQEKEVSIKQNEAAFIVVLKKHLKSVSDKDYAAMKSTMSPYGKMELIQPSSEIVYTVDGFMKFHQDWFNVPNWSVSTKILSTNIGEKIGVATTEFLYQEPERNGKPYFNRLIVSYTLEKINNKWYFIKDHASSIEKTK
jgi:hypothetical protein